MKKLVAILLVLCLCVSLFSLAAFAEEEQGTIDQSSESAQNSTLPELYVSANSDAGMDGKVLVDWNLIGSSGTLYLPGKANTDMLCFSWDDTGITLSQDGVEYESGTAPIAPKGSSTVYTVRKGNTVRSLTVKTEQGSNQVEPMFLELDESKGTIKAMNEDDAHDTKCYGTATFGDVSKNISIKGRGNSTWTTWGFAKKPYNITFYSDDTYEDSKKVELVDGVIAKKWSLIANFLDNSLMRNKIAMDLADALGIGLKTEYADVWMNGKYLGNYLITPKNDYDAPKGGYALENDNYLEEDEDQFAIPGMFEIGKITNDRGYYNRITVKDIGKDAGVDMSAIESYFTEAWSAVEDYESEAYQNYFDMDSWAKMFLMYEVSKTYDCFSGSLLMHRDGLTDNDKLIAGPAWDYDVSFGRTLHKFFIGMAENVQVNAEGWYVDSIGYMAVDEPISLLQELQKHPSFMKHVAKIYNENKSAFEDISANVDHQREIIRDSALMDSGKFGILNVCADYVVAPNTMSMLGTGKYRLQYEITVGWDNYVNNLKEYCTKRVMWLSDHLAPGVDITTFHGGTVKTSEEPDLVVAENSGLPFDDVFTNDWFYPYVKYVYENGLFSGNSDTSFDPNATMTRGMFVTVLWAREGKPSAGDSSFKDLSADWYKAAVAWAAENGIVGGYDEDFFGPEDPVTREQMATIMYQYAKFKNYDTNSSGDLGKFTDAAGVAEYAKEPMMWAVGHNIISGTDKGLDPIGKATRAQVATVMKAFNEQVG